jgi:ABC-type lipoprotein release transport system permease subunit
MLSSLSGGGVNLFAPTADLVTFVIVSVLMAAVGLAATLWPARRAAQADPLVALRHL